MPSRLERSAIMRRTLLVTLAANGLAALVKLLPGIASGSLSLAAGGLDSLSDAGTNVIALAASRAAAHPPDERHPYGHRKIETLVAIFVGVLLLLTAGRIAWAAVRALNQGAPGPVVTPLVILAPVIAALINIVTSAYEARQGRRAVSELLTADARHTLTDAVVSLALVVGLLAVRAGFAWADPAMALGVSALVAWVGVGILRHSGQVLADAAPLDAEALATSARSVPGVAGVHKVRSRGPLDAVAVDLHVQVNPALGIGRAHAIGHEVSRRIAADFAGVTDVVVHVEPDQAPGGDILSGVQQVLGELPVNAHEVYVHTGAQTEVTIHLEIPEAPTLGEAHAVATEVEATVRQRVSGVDRVVTHLEPGPARETVSTPSDEDAIKAAVSAAVAGIPGLAEAHSLSVAEVDGALRLSVHVRADGRMPLATAHDLAEQLEARLRVGLPRLERVTIHVEPFKSEP